MLTGSQEVLRYEDVDEGLNVHENNNAINETNALFDCEIEAGNGNF